MVGTGRHIHDAGGRTSLQNREQLHGQVKVTDVIGCELRLNTIRREAEGGRHDAGIVEEDV